MNLSHRLLSSALLAGAVLSAALLPLATVGAKPVTIQLEERPVFVGQLRELAAPYIALATGLSLGVGAVSLSVLSWQQASRKLSRYETDMSALRQQLAEQEALVERLKFSETKLQTSGLEQFLQPASVAAHAASTASLPAATRSTFAPDRVSLNTASSDKGVLEGELLETFVDRPQPVSQPTVPDRRLVTPVTRSAQSATSSGFSTAGLEFFLDNSTAALSEPPTQSTPSSSPMPAMATEKPITVTPITEPVKIQALTALPAAQAFSGFVRRSWQDAADSRSPLTPMETSVQLQELLSHLKQVTAQIERLQTTQNSALGNGSGNRA
ncbi:hypothetical protein [Thermocoleostomius sinensis]|uniref:Uncharacterized protein n=1 Tax=Thermocoleostomius sinensis A174 TaxID=2016057 RepID=A0A9E8ZHY5_9CYAN|nr:hypothetical protein [Thermocoleostomius sinensis]WAL62052.1 hypothetical protein OXH18_08730 [Thermocoleostomius sinensis A174]